MAFTISEFRGKALNNAGARANLFDVTMTGAGAAGLGVGPCSSIRGLIGVGVTDLFSIAGSTCLRRGVGDSDLGRGAGETSLNSSSESSLQSL